jgi:hypothetical protein
MSLEKRWWTTGRQVSVVDTLLELAACGVIDFATIDPDGCIEIPSLQFEDVQLDLPDTDADMTDTDFPSSPFPLHVPEVTTTSKLVVSPRIEAFFLQFRNTSLLNGSDNICIELVALIEFIIENYQDLTTEDLWERVKSEMQTTSLKPPLKGNGGMNIPSSLSKQELSECLMYFNRCGGRNSIASMNRTTCRAQIKTLKNEYLQQVPMPQLREALIGEDCLMDWHRIRTPSRGSAPKLDGIRKVLFHELPMQDEEEDDEWVGTVDDDGEEREDEEDTYDDNDDEGAWFDTDDDDDDENENENENDDDDDDDDDHEEGDEEEVVVDLSEIIIDEVDSSPSPTPTRTVVHGYAPPPHCIMERHPVTALAYLPCMKAAYLRHIMIECHVPKSKIVIAYVLFYHMLFNEPPNLCDIPGDTILDLCYQQLEERDDEILSESFNAKLSSDTSKMKFYLASDDTNHKGTEQHVIAVSMFNPATNSPEFSILNLSPTPGKDANSNSDEDIHYMKKSKLPLEQFNGSNMDHAALAEGRLLASKIDTILFEKNGTHLKGAIYDVGDNAHKTALVWKVLSEAVNGKDTGTIQDFHPYQILYQLNYNMSKETLTALMMGIEAMSLGDRSLASFMAMMPDKIQVTRWNSVGRAAKSYLELLKLKDVDGEYLILKMFEYMVDHSSGVSKAAWQYMSDYGTDRRMIAGMIFENEFNDTVWDPWNVFDRTKSKQGFGNGFGVFDVADQVTHHTDLFWKKALDNPKSVFPKFVKYLEDWKASGDAGGSGIHDFYMERLKAGIINAHKEYLKLYRHCHNGKYMILHIFCRGRSGSAMRVIGDLLKTESKMSFFEQANFTPIQADNEFDINFKVLVGEDKEACLAVVEGLGLFDESLVTDMVKLSQNMCKSKEDEFAKSFNKDGGECKSLFNSLCKSLAPFPTATFIVELVFSVMKAEWNANESLDSLNGKVKYLLNVQVPSRNKRRLLIGVNVGNKADDRHLRTKEQKIVCSTQVADDIVLRYNPSKMKNVKSRGKLHGNRKKKDGEITKRAVTVRKNKKAKGKKSKVIDFKQRRKDVSNKQTPHQLTRAKISQVTVQETRMDVILEENREVASQITHNALCHIGYNGVSRITPL